MRLGDLDEALRMIKDSRKDNPYVGNVTATAWRMAHDSAISCVEATPTIDAVPVKRGTWKLNKDGSGTCDQCHFTQKAVWDFDGWQNFCGVCGADMRERKDGDG